MSTLAVAIVGRSTPTVFVGGGNARFYALDAATGAVLWQTTLGSPSKGDFIWSSPALYNGDIYVGLSSLYDCPLVQGKFFQLSATTGAILQVFDVVPNTCRGGSVWGSPAIDST